MIRAALDAVGQLPDNEIALADTALLLARLDAPGADWRRAQKHLTLLAREAAELQLWAGSSAQDQAEALSGMLGCRHDYSGDYETYDDLQNLNLIAVTERRRGMPIGLGIIWLHCAEVAGWDCYGINFPSHFVLGLDGDDGQALLDIFAGGRILEPEDLEGMLARIGDGRRRAKAAPVLTVRMTKREVLIRLQQNISYRREQSGDLAGALRVVEDMLRFAPGDINLWQQAAGINQQMGQIAAAVRCMGRVVDLIPPGADSDRARAVMRRLRSSLN
ncbi:transglutaminase family protein [Acidisoma cellulosilytica]|uniref:Transglutaminase family protein n=1 Tax=Acidisoma cellulosilyticum TaxID=2802395 RepID=A0A963YZH4_9PROT|nr:transglutaminase-like domain-containing protein [Acidisoma cellulosilyticum]MCB8880018.1 transglutaminase family protein [Acidisoma cellulosilyticum]